VLPSGASTPTNTFVVALDGRAVTGKTVLGIAAGPEQVVE
jgi:predicted ribonuclease YlaK